MLRDENEPASGGPAVQKIAPKHKMSPHAAG